jgi:hypothetical protein
VNETNAIPLGITPAQHAKYLATLKAMPPQVPLVYFKPCGWSGWLQLRRGVFPEEVPLGEGDAMLVVDAPR